MAAVEVTVRVSNDEQKFIQKFLLYSSFTVSHEDPVLKNCVDETVKNFKGEVEDVVVKFSYVW